MFDFFKLKSPIGRSYNTNPDDVRKIKKALNGLGYYDEPDNGITPYPDTGLIRGIESFQRDHGLRPDGVMKPDGETVWMLGSVVGDISQGARNLQRMGRNGDTILAHITPAEAMLLKNKGGAGTVHPVTGLLEFSDESKKKGEYIWHTAGDGKVRESHAERNGQVYSWDTPPDGGHPGEAPNCRCTAKETDVNCKELKHQIKNQELAVNAALKDWESIQKELEETTKEYNRLRRICDEGRKNSAIHGGLGALGGVPGRAWGIIRGIGEAALPPLVEAQDACSEADAKEVQVNTLDERAKSAYAHVEKQREIIKGLREKLTESGCDF